MTAKETGLRWWQPTRRRLLLLAGVLVLGGGVWWWTEGKGRYLFFPRNFGVVDEGLVFRSGQIHRRLIEDVLEDHGIRVIVDLDTDPPEDENEVAEQEAADRLGIRKVDVLGLNGYGTGDPEGYAQAVAAMAGAHAKGTPVLVHCAAGAQRTGGVVAVYRMLVEGWDGRRAYEDLMDYRREPKGQDHLVPFVNENLAGIAQRLVEMGVIPKVPDPLPRLGP